MRRLSLLLPALALGACSGPPPVAPVVNTDGKAIAANCGVPESMFTGETGQATVTLLPTLTAEQRTCTLREVRRSLPDARILEAGTSRATPTTAPKSN